MTPPPLMPTDDLVEVATGLHDLVAAEASAGEAQGRLTEPVVTALADSGLLAMWVPTELGGRELTPVSSLRVVEALSRADGSTGWVQMAASLSTGTGAAYLNRDVAAELFGGRLSVIAGHGAPLGRADVEPGGFRLSGNWSYASGVLHANFVHTGGIVYEDGRPRLDPERDEPEFRVFVVPVELVELGGNWDALGLRSTGSIDYGITDVFVPEGYTHLQPVKVANTGGEIYKLGILGFANIGHTGFALGVARRLLDELAAVARRDNDRPSILAESGGGEAFQQQFGHHEAAFRAARALAYDAWTRMERAVHSPGPIPTRTLTLARLALNHLTTVATDIARFAFSYGGGGALRPGTLQRFVRDMMTGAQHATTSPRILSECAKDLLGLAEGQEWGMRGLVHPT